jgi:hypothetical protein
MVEEEQLNKQIGTDDEIAVITAQQLLSELENDVKVYGEMIDKHKADKLNYEEQLKIDERLWEILERPGSVKLLNPTREFEKDPEYWDLMQKKQMYRIREDRAVAKHTMHGFDSSIEETTKASIVAQDKLTKFKNDNIELIARMKRND